MPVRRKLIRAVVDRVLTRHWDDSRPVNVHRLASALGAEVRTEPAEDELSGFLLRDVEQQRIVIGVNANQSKVRQRFTIAHELGHFLLHEGERVHVDRTDRLFLMKRRDQRSKEGTDVEEVEANIFAAELLMPASFIEADMERVGPVDPSDEDALRSSAKQYGVSAQAFLFRLINLGYVQLE